MGETPTGDTLSHAEQQLCDQLLKLDEALALDPTRADIEPPAGLSPELWERWRRSYAAIKELNRVFTPRPRTATKGQPTDRNHDLTPAVVGDPAPPQRIDRFQVLRIVGRGSVSVVYEALDPKAGRIVALKVPRAGVFESSSIRRMFLREAEAAVRLGHPGIVALLEVGEFDSSCFIVNDYCPGPTLSDWLEHRAQPVSPSEAATLVEALAEAVQHAHGRGVLHRNIKPGNVLLEPREFDSKAQGGEDPTIEWHPKLTDFGLARLFERSSSESRSDAILGTPEYMAPEQVQGRLGDLDATTDVYGLGGLLYHILTMHPPFRGPSTAATVHQVVYEEPRPLRRIRPDVPRDLEAICMKCLAKLPEERYATAHELAQDLRRFVRGQVTIARPLRPWERLTKWGRRKPALAALVSSAVISALVLSTLMGLYHRQLSAAYERESVANAALAQQVEINRRGLRAADYAHAWEELQKNRGGALRNLFVNHSSAEDQASPPNFAANILRRYFDADEHVLYKHTGAVYAAEFSPDGSSVASTGSDGTIRLWNLTARRPADVKPMSCGSETNTLAFSPSGEFLASGSDDGLVRIWNCATGATVNEFATSGDRATNVLDVCYSPDGRTLAVSTRAGFVHLYSTRDWQEATTSPLKHGNAVNDAAFSNDGDLLATTSDDHRLRFWDLSSGVARHDWDVGKANCLALAFAHHSPLLALADLQPPAVRFWSVADNRPAQRFEFGNRWIHSLDFSRDDRRLALSNKDGAVATYDIARGELEGTLFVDAECIWSVRFSRTSDTLLLGVGDGTVRLVPFEALNSRQLTATFTTPIANVAFPPEADRIVIREQTGQLASWNLRMSEKLVELQTQPKLGPQDLLAVSSKSVAAFTRDRSRQLVFADLKSGRDLLRIDGFTGNLMSLAFDATGSRLVSGHEGGELHVWDAASGQQVASTSTGQPSLYALGYSTDNRYIGCAGSNRLSLWDAASLKRIAGPVVLVGEAYRLAFQPGGPYLASHDGDTLVMWNTATHVLQRLPAHDDEITAIAFSPAGPNQVLVTGGSDGVLWMWDVHTMRKLAMLARGAKNIPSIAFSDDGRFLAAGILSDSGTTEVKIWNGADPRATDTANAQGRRD